MIFKNIAALTSGSTQKCSKPFKIDEKDYYFCQLNNTNYECKIDSGENKICTRSKGLIITEVILWIINVYF